MGRGPIYDAAADAALIALFREYRGNWWRHVEDYEALKGHSLGGMKYRIYKGLSLGTKPPDDPQEAAETYPEMGMPRFTDDPRAERDHGSPQRLGGPPVTTSYGTISYGCVAGWVA